MKTFKKVSCLFLCAVLAALSVTAAFALDADYSLLSEWNDATLNELALDKLKQLDQTADTNDFRVLVKDAGVGYEALRVSHTGAWDTATDSDHNDGWSEFRFLRTAAIEGVTLEYMLENTNTDTESQWGRYLVQYINVDDAGTKTYEPVLNGDSILTADGQWHTLELDTYSDTFTGFIVKLYHFEGTMFVRNVNIINEGEAAATTDAPAAETTATAAGSDTTAVAADSETTGNVTAPVETKGETQTADVTGQLTEDRNDNGKMIIIICAVIAAAAIAVIIIVIFKKKKA